MKKTEKIVKTIVSAKVEVRQLTMRQLPYDYLVSLRYKRLKGSNRVSAYASAYDGQAIPFRGVPLILVAPHKSRRRVTLTMCSSEAEILSDADFLNAVIFPVRSTKLSV